MNCIIHDISPIILLGPVLVAGLMREGSAEVPTTASRPLFVKSMLVKLNRNARVSPEYSIKFDKHMLLMHWKVRSRQFK